MLTLNGCCLLILSHLNSFLKVRVFVLNCLLIIFTFTFTVNFQYLLVVIVLALLVLRVKGGGSPLVARTLPQQAPEFPVPLAISVFQEPSGTSNLSERRFGAALRFSGSICLCSLS